MCSQLHLGIMAAGEVTSLGRACHKSPLINFSTAEFAKRKRERDKENNFLYMSQQYNNAKKKKRKFLLIKVQYTLRMLHGCLMSPAFLRMNNSD